MAAVPGRTLTIEAELGATWTGTAEFRLDSLEQEVVRNTLDLSRALQPGEHVAGDIVLKRVKK